MREALLLLPLAVGVLLIAACYKKLPSKIAVHFDVEGNPNSTISKKAGLPLLLLMGSFGYVIPYLATKQFFWLRLIIIVFMVTIATSTVILPNIGKKKLMFIIVIPLTIVFFLYIVIWAFAKAFAHS